MEIDLFDIARKLAGQKPALAKADGGRIEEGLRKAGYEITPSAERAAFVYQSSYSLLLHGPCGTGKTEFFQALRRVGYPIIIASMPYFPAMGLAELCDWLECVRNRDIVLDDAGAEMMANNYGERFEMFSFIVEQRARLSRVRTHFTTNLSPAEMMARYGERVLDRIRGLAVEVEFTGVSRRRAKPVAQN